MLINFAFPDLDEKDYVHHTGSYNGSITGEFYSISTLLN